MHLCHRNYNQCNLSEWAVCINIYGRNDSLLCPLIISSHSTVFLSCFHSLSLLPLLKHDVGICFQVTHVDFLAIFDHFWMLPTHQPADVREEEAAICIVRIGIRVRVLVMLAMVSNPDPEAILSGQGVHVKEEYFDSSIRLERSMGPESMGAHCNALARCVD